MEQSIKVGNVNAHRQDVIGGVENGKHVTDVHGVIHNIRSTKWGGFIILRKAKGLMQVVFQNDVKMVGLGSASELKKEMSVRIHGEMKSATIKDPHVVYSNIEVAAIAIEVLSIPTAETPIDTTMLAHDGESHLAFKLDNRQVSIRNTRDMAIFRVNAQVVKACVDFLDRNGFMQIFTPKIVSAGAEGGANVFEMDYFGRKVYLAQSPQFYKQIAVGAFESVFEIAPVYRAEKHNTARHLNEYISIDLEMGFINDHRDVMTLEVTLLRSVLEHLQNTCRHEFQLLGATLPSLPDEVPVYRLQEVHDLLHAIYPDRLTKDHRGEPDMASEEEVLLCEYALEKHGSDFVFVTHFPRKHRAFYSMDDPKDPELTLSFDLLMRGREITSGSQRMHREEDYITKMKDLGMDPSAFEFYLDVFRHGMPPHGGLAIGLERLTAGLLNIHSVKETSLFPRDVNRITP